MITLRGKALLEKADVVIYAGSLVNPQLLEYCKEDCEIYNSARMTLEEVIEVIVQAEAKKADIVRLHTGAYDCCPGVSACFGAAASLHLEYTLPEVSQSLIITRMEGRTKVPEKEQIESFASHQASMAVYLSTGMLGELSRRLIAGGYPKDTPSALCYKVTWPEEETYLCTVEQLEQTAREHGITRTALVLVGEVIAHQGYEKSRLYAPDFATGYREARKQK